MGLANVDRRPEDRQGAMNPTAKVPLSVVIPTFNEERNIEDCLRSVSWADEIILVDGGSTDQTREKAGRYTSKIILTENAPAETQRLKGLKEIKHEWFFLLDADERVSEELASQIAEVVSSGSSKSAYRVLRKNIYKNKPVHLHDPDYQLRLFKRSEIDSLPQEIHRIPQVKGGIGVLKGCLMHYFFTSVGDYIAKLNRYTRIEASYWRNAGKKVTGFNAIYYLVIRPKWRFFQCYFLKKGFLDGFFGFFFSVSSAYYEIMVAMLARGDEKN